MLSCPFVHYILTHIAVPFIHSSELLEGTNHVLHPHFFLNCISFFTKKQGKKWALKCFLTFLLLRPNLRALLET